MEIAISTPDCRPLASLSSFKSLAVVMHGMKSSKTKLRVDPLGSRLSIRMVLRRPRPEPGER